MKMQVGDLHMSQGEGISVQGTPIVSRHAIAATQNRSSAAHSAPTNELRLGPLRLPRWSATTYAAIALLLAALSVALLVAGVVLEVPLFALAALNMFAGALGSALIARQVRHSPAPSTGVPTALEIERRTRLLTHLKTLDAPRTVEALLSELGWTEQALLPTLADLVNAERIDEDLDLESGHWTYALPAPRMVLDTEVSARALPDHARPVSERAEALSSKSPH